ncbi:DUF6022 family protein [Thermoactinomyces sp. CICC 10521]|uniref:DUF6022 family protein n=1 Tax=Thermoactinomyces sp. CICC 10521 TaxID=2767426 RepID=UPI0018DBA838|nr:DUF6022 family protein [Thermoactinomyces sp. CICC 10521]MBH8608694.1 hypothetical protein [Thermoactinomyces sp. CICC 10521]
MEEIALTFKPTMSIEEIGGVIEGYVTVRWKKVLEENYDVFLQSFEKIGEPTYGLYVKKLMTPVFEKLQKSGFVVKGPLNLHDSLEEWGTMEKRERMLWSVVKDQHQAPIGTFILDLFHNHTQFEIPSMPRILVTEETGREKIIEVIRKMKEKRQGD